MEIKGVFRDILTKNGKVIEDKGWKSNSIAPDYGQFLAAVMKKEFKDISKKPVGIGIEYLAVGSSSNNDPGNFKNRVAKFFENWTAENADKPYHDTNDPDPESWVWAKKIDDAGGNTGDIKYLKPDEPQADTVTNAITNYLQITVTFKNNESQNSEPNTAKNLDFEDFALIGIYNSGTANAPAFDTERMFFINYRTHDTITKEPSMELTRTIRLKFPPL